MSPRGRDADPFNVNGFSKFPAGLMDNLTHTVIGFIAGESAARSVRTRASGLSAEAQAYGVGSMLCTPLWVDGQTLATLSFYAPAAAFSEHDQRIAGTSSARPKASSWSATTGRLYIAVISITPYGPATPPSRD